MTGTGLPTENHPVLQEADTQSFNGEVIDRPERRKFVVIDFFTLVEEECSLSVSCLAHDSPGRGGPGEKSQNWQINKHTANARQSLS